jgi:hypothetical protein
VRLIARQVRPEPAEGDAREIVREVPKEVLPQVTTAVRRSGRSRKPKERS